MCDWMNDNKQMKHFLLRLRIILKLFIDVNRQNEQSTTNLCKKYGLQILTILQEYWAINEKMYKNPTTTQALQESVNYKWQYIDDKWEIIFSHLSYIKHSNKHTESLRMRSMIDQIQSGLFITTIELWIVGVMYCSVIKIIKQPKKIFHIKDNEINFFAKFEISKIIIQIVKIFLWANTIELSEIEDSSFDNRGLERIKNISYLRNCQ
jgi:hypothetical protein